MILLVLFFASPRPRIVLGVQLFVEWPVPSLELKQVFCKLTLKNLWKFWITVNLIILNWGLIEINRLIWEYSWRQQMLLIYFIYGSNTVLGFRELCKLSYFLLSHLDYERVSSRHCQLSVRTFSVTIPELPEWFMTENYIPLAKVSTLPLLLTEVTVSTFNGAQLCFLQ